MQPRRLFEDESAAPWLAEQVRGAAAPSPMTEEARVRVGVGIATRLRAADPAGLVPWRVLAVAAAALALLLALRLAPLDAGPQRIASQAVHAERTAPRAAPASPAPASRPPAEPATPVHALVGTIREAPTPQREVAPSQARTSAPVRHRAETRHRKPTAPSPSSTATAPAPSWLAEARAALADDPQRTLDLIRANRDRRVAVSPELLELAARAVEARDAKRAPHAAAP